MTCDCCGKDEGYDIMYRTLDTRVYCLWCSKRTALCCYDKPIIPTTWFRIPMSLRALKSLEERGHTRVFEESTLNPLLIRRVVHEKGQRTVRPKYQAKTALKFGRKPRRIERIK